MIDTNKDILNRRDRSLEQPALNRSIAKNRTIRAAKDLPPRQSYENAGLSGVFRIIILLLLMVAVMRVMVGSSNIMTFTGLLDVLQTAPSINVTWLTTFVEWGNSVANIPLIGWALNFLVETTSVAIYIAAGVIQIITYVIWIMQYLY